MSNYYIHLLNNHRRLKSYSCRLPSRFYHQSILQIFCIHLDVITYSLSALCSVRENRFLKHPSYAVNIKCRMYVDPVFDFLHSYSVALGQIGASQYWHPFFLKIWSLTIFFLSFLNWKYLLNSNIIIFFETGMWKKSSVKDI